MITVGRAGATDQANIAAMWQISFGDSDGYVKWFFDTRYDPRNTFVAYDNGEAVASLQLFQRHLRLRNNEFTCPFIVGACTLPQYRKQGLMGMLLKAIAEEYPVITLYPARTEFYLKYGWGTFAYAYEQAEEHRAIEGTADPEQMYALYSQAAKAYPTALWSDRKEFELWLAGEQIDGARAVVTENGYGLYTDTSAQILTLDGQRDGLPQGKKTLSMTPFKGAERKAGGMLRIHPLAVDGLQAGDAKGECMLSIYDPLEQATGNYRIWTEKGQYRVLPVAQKGQDMSISDFSGMVAGLRAETELAELFPEVECICLDQY